ncbi:MAG: hypothetical protein KDB03_15485 [Planctomycetales bacterium]|nr:hypothetical protein [Planctomycetales bacterium]
MMPNIKYRGSRQQLGPLSCVVVRPDTDIPIGKVAVFCHGFGASGEDLVGLAGELLDVHAHPTNGVMLVFPAAPISLDDEGMPGGRAWWRLSIQRLMDAMEAGHYERVREEVPPGIDEARDKLSQCIQAALSLASLDEGSLLLGGFSQGAMLSVDTALRGLSEPPSQIVLFSGALICERLWKPLANRLANSEVFQSHGNFDPILPIQMGAWLRELLLESGCNVSFLEFDGPHTIPMAAITRAKEMLFTNC